MNKRSSVDVGIYRVEFSPVDGNNDEYYVSMIRFIPVKIAVKPLNYPDIVDLAPSIVDYAREFIRKNGFDVEKCPLKLIDAQTTILKYSYINRYTLTIYVVYNYVFNTSCGELLVVS